MRRACVLGQSRARERKAVARFRERPRRGGTPFEQGLRLELIAAVAILSVRAMASGMSASSERIDATLVEP